LGWQGKEGEEIKRLGRVEKGKEKEGRELRRRGRHAKS